ncbi:MAG: hypothetical protein ACI9F9_001582, partial [Candidatus Paceibacteria bacterium]
LFLDSSCSTTPEPTHAQRVEEFRSAKKAG